MRYLSTVWQIRPTAETEPTRLIGHWLVVARVLWSTTIIAVLAVFAAGLPRTYAVASSLRPETQTALAHLGIAPTINALTIVSLDSVMMLGFTAFALFIFLRRSDDWMVMFVSVMLVLTCMLYTAPAFEAPVPDFVIALLAAAAEVGQVAFVFLFPDGRVVPRWAWMILLPLPLWRVAMWAVEYLPHYRALQPSGEDFYVIPQDVRDLSLFLALLTFGIVAQVYRYRSRSDPMRRQQTKWLILGAATTVVIVGGYVLAVNSLPTASDDAARALLLRLAGRTANHLALFCLPVALMFSILRYRLWDIDTVINRALVYGTLTGTVALMYGILVVGFQFVFHSVTESDELALVVSTLATVLAVRPARGYIQRVIDRRFYRSKYDAARTVAAFASAVAVQPDLESLSEQLLTVVNETMHPSEVSLWVWLPGGDHAHEHLVSLAPAIVEDASMP